MGDGEGRDYSKQKAMNEVEAGGLHVCMCSQAQTPAHSASVSSYPCCHTGEVVAQVSETLTLNPKLNPNLNQERSLLQFLKERKPSVKLDP